MAKTREQEVSIKVTAQNQASNTLRSVAKEVKSLGTAGSGFDKLFGGRGVGTLLAGGGAAAAMTAVLRVADRAVRSTRDIVQQYREGRIEAGEMVERIAGVVPVLGDAVRLGRTIRSLFEDVSEETREIAQNLKAAGVAEGQRSEERRVGKEWRCGWSADHER